MTNIGPLSLAFYSLRNFTSNANAVKGEKVKNISKEIKKTKNKIRSN